MTSTIRSTIQPEDGSRVDPEAGIREHATFFGDHGHRFGVLHAPLGPSAAGVVVCPPLYAEHLRNYRREVLVARTLAARGVAVQRFHYRGTGNSEGEPADLSFEIALEDALAAAAELRERSGVERVGFLGTRWGGVIAAAAAVRGGDAQLVLWEPAIDPRWYVRDVFRGRSVSDLKNAARGAAVGGDPLQELRANGVAEILGYEFHARLYESVLRHPLADELRPGPHSVLLAQLGEGRGVGRDTSALVERVRAAGGEVQVRAIPGREAWWFGGERALRGEELVWAATLVELTVEWFVRHLTGKEDR